MSTLALHFLVGVYMYFWSVVQISGWLGGSLEIQMLFRFLKDVHIFGHTLRRKA